MVEGEGDETGFSELAPDVADVMSGFMVDGLDLDTEGTMPPVCGSCTI